MPQITGPMTINDGSATPVAKTFAPERVSPEASVFSERSAATSAGFTRLTYGLDMAKANRKTNRIDISLNVPVLRTVEGNETVAGTALFKGYWVLPDVMTEGERSNVHAFTANSIGHANVKAAVKSLDPAY